MSFERLACVASLLLACAVAGCTPNIGDKCQLSTDCSLRGDRLCDTSQPAGYCTIFNCAPNHCPDNASCVEFHPSVPGCPYDDYKAPSRSARTFCLAACTSSGDCRAGYVCADPKQGPWNAAILDDVPQLVCVVAPAAGDAGEAGADVTPPVCGGPLPEGGADGQ